MRLKLIGLIVLFIVTTSSYALTCDPTYQVHAFKRVIISVVSGDVRCKYYNGNANDEIDYSIGDSFLDSYLPASGNWVVSVPRFWECKAKNSQDCEFRKQ